MIKCMFSCNLFHTSVSSRIFYVVFYYLFEKNKRAVVYTCFVLLYNGFREFNTFKREK